MVFSKSNVIPLFSAVSRSPVMPPPHLCFFIRDFALAFYLSRSQPSFSTLSDDVIPLLAYLYPSLFSLPLSLSAGLRLFPPHPFDSPYLLDVEPSAFKTFLTAADDTSFGGSVIFGQRADITASF